MPTGVYERTKKHREISRRTIKKAQKVAWSLPRSPAQLDGSRKTEKQLTQIRELGKRPRTQTQRDAARTTCLNRKGKTNPHKGNVFGDTIVEHHDDLQHGKERPDDVANMTLSEHARLHAKYRKRDKGKFT